MEQIRRARCVGRGMELPCPLQIHHTSTCSTLKVSEIHFWVLFFVCWNFFLRFLFERKRDSEREHEWGGGNYKVLGAVCQNSEDQNIFLIISLSITPTKVVFFHILR